jgi:MFS transporter, ACS family, solute carrier family 17 (sodium-dependent inorganic phosphate cotransporter), other
VSETIRRWFWPRRYTVVGLSVLATLIGYIDRVNISVAILPMQQAFGWSETIKGFVLSSFFIGYLLFQIPAGYLANRLGGKIVLGFSVVWWSLFTVLTPVAAAMSLPVLIAARIALGAGEAAMFPGAYSLFAKWTPPTERSRAVSLLLSGIPVGTLLALSTTGFIVVSFGWPAAFYLFGALGAIWAVLWFTKVSDDPATDPRISASELAILPQQSASARSGAIPWGRLLSQPAVWALIVNHFCSNWGLYVLLAWLPSYFVSVQGLGMVNAGLYSAIPWLTMFVMTNVGAWAADSMVRRGVSLTAVRKIMQATGLLGASVFLLLAQDVSTGVQAMLLMCGALGALALTWSGFAPNHLDIAPRYADVLMGITNTAGTLPGIIGVVITGWLIDVTGSYGSAFVLAASLNAVGAIVWLAFGTGKRVIDD